MSLVQILLGETMFEEDYLLTHTQFSGKEVIDMIKSLTPEQRFQFYSEIRAVLTQWMPETRDDNVDNFWDIVHKSHP